MIISSWLFFKMHRCAQTSLVSISYTSLSYFLKALQSITIPPQPLYYFTLSTKSSFKTGLFSAFQGLRREILQVGCYLIFSSSWSLFSQAEHISAFSLPPHTLSSSVSKEANMLLKPAGKILNIFLTHTFKVLFHLSPGFSLRGDLVSQSLALRERNMEYFLELPYN